MDDGTKKQALAKLDKLTHDVAFPDWINNNDYMNAKYHDFNVTTDYVTNLFNAQMYNLLTMGQVRTFYISKSFPLPRFIEFR